MKTANQPAYLILCIVFVSFGLAVGVARADLTDGLLVHYKFNDGSGTTATDSSGNERHGTLFNNPQWVQGMIGGALEFAGNGDYVEDEDGGDYLNGLSAVSVAMWIKSDVTNTDKGFIIGMQPNGGDRPITMRYDAAGASHGGTNLLKMGVASTDRVGQDGQQIESSDNSQTTEWQHVCMTWESGGLMYFYINGVEDTPTGRNNANTGGTTCDNTTLLIGKGGKDQAADQSWDGLIDEVLIYNRVLSPDEIVELMTWTGGADAGPDQRIEGGTLVTLNGAGPPDATSFAWEQIIVGDEPAVTLSDPNSAVTTFTPPAHEIGYILTFRLTVDSPESGVTTDECLVYVTAPNEPRVAPGNFRMYPSDLGYLLEWDTLVDADDYGVGFKIGPGMYFWFWTVDNFYPLVNLTEGLETLVAVRGRNSYGEGTISDDVPLLPMRNYALPTDLGGINPPSDYVYVISHYAIASLNNAVVEDDTNDSWDGIYKDEDYWGYTWDAPLYMDHVTYFTGGMFGDGGWFTSLKVQYTKDGVEWLDVPTQIAPDYDFTDQRQGKQAYTRYDMHIPTLYGMGIRIYGAPGGTATFTSVSELEIFGDNASSRPLVVQGIDGEVPERGTGAINASFSFSTRGDITSMIYSQISGPAVTITVTGDPLIATFQAPGVDADTELVFEIEGSDGTDTLTDEVTMVVKDLVTTAVAGPDQAVPEGSAVTLDGSGSVTTTGDITYLWTQTGGIIVTLDNTNQATANFEAPVLWDYTDELTFRLDVDDGAGGASSDEVTVTVQNALAWPAYPLEAISAEGDVKDLLHLGQTPTDRIVILPRWGPQHMRSGFDPLQAFGGEGNIEPYPGQEYDFTGTGVTTTRNPMIWTPVHQDNGQFLWSGRAGQDFSDFQSVYHLYIISPEDRDVQWHFRRDDDYRAYNNGVQIISSDWIAPENNGNWHIRDGLLAQGTGLIKGLNSINLRYEEQGGGNFLSFGVTDTDGVPFDDLYYSLGPSFVLADAYAVRSLPTSYQAGGAVDVELSVRVNDDNKPSSVTVSEPIPGGLTVVDAGGGTVVGGSLNWSFSGGEVATQMINYTLGVPAGTTGALNFTGTVSFPTTDSIKGDKIIYETPSAPENLAARVLIMADLYWSPSPEEGVTGYKVYRSVNGGAWEELALLSSTSYVDKWIEQGSTYNYQVSAVNAAGLEGPTSSPTGEQMITIQVREAEDFNYGGGLYPGFQDCPAAVEATAADDLTGTDFWHPSTGGPNEYRPNNVTPDGLGIETLADADNPSYTHTNIGWIDPGSWYRYTFDIPAAGPGDPEGGWIRLSFRVASPGGGTITAYWDEALVGTVNYNTGSWQIYTEAVMEAQIQTTPGAHTLRVEATAGQLNLDTVGVEPNAPEPTWETFFEDDFEDYTTLYSFADLVDPLIGHEYTVINGGGEPLGAWRVWYTLGELLGNEDPAIDAMTDNYVIIDSDLAGAVEVDEELITPPIDCTNHLRVRFDFNYNYRAYLDDTTHAQIAEVDIRTSDDGVTWGDWTNLASWDTSVGEFDSGSRQVDLSAIADGKHIQIRFHYYDANFDYWFAVDDLRVSGDKEEPIEPKGEILTVGYVAGVADLTWEVFGDGNYTVEYTNDLTSGSWDPVPGTTWPIAATDWSGDINAIFGEGVYLRVRSE